MPGRLGQLVARPIADPRVMSSIPARADTFVEIDHEIDHEMLSVTNESIARSTGKLLILSLPGKTCGKVN